MEHSKFGAFTIQCNKCSSGRSVSDEDYVNQTIKCWNQECNNEFTIYEGIRNGLKKVDDHIIPNFFLANEMSNQLIEVKVGYTRYVDYPEGIKKVYNVMLFPTGNFLAGATDITVNGFTLFTSIADDKDVTMIGQTQNVMVSTNFKGSDYEIPWFHILQYAYEQLRNGEYLTSIFLSETAFEVYVDSTLTLGYKDVGLDQDTIKRLLFLTSLPEKVNPLMNNVFGVKLASSSAWDDWEKKALKWRNEIAHGTKITATKEEATIVYKAVVDAIFHFIEGVDKYLKEKGHKNGLFFRTE